MSQFPGSRILIFARAPVAGEVKTRLIPALGPDGAARLYRKLLLRTVTVAVESGLCPMELWCAPDTQHVALLECQVLGDVTLHRQQGSDLGARMAFAMKETLQATNSAVLIGGDIPLLDAAMLRQGLMALEDGADVVLGPAEDGGYYLIGLRRMHDAVFAEVPWGTADVLERTRNRIKGLGLRCEELPVLWDVDRPADLERLSGLDW